MLKIFDGILPRIIMLVVVLAAIVGLAYMYGRSSMRAEYEKKSAEQAAYLMKLQQQIAQDQSRIVVRYVDKVRTIYHEVPKYEPPADECRYLSGNFRMYWDSVATGIPMSSATGRPDAAPVAVSDVAETAKIAAQQYRAMAAQLEALQAERRSVSP